MEVPKLYEKMPFSEKEELSVKQKFQKSNFDCGQTCLDMLGYDGHKMFPDHEIFSSDLRSIPGAQEIMIPVGHEETLDYSYPHIWILLGKDRVEGARHWVIRHRDKIYCPTVGTMDSDEYKKKYIAFILQKFILPFNGQKVPDRYYERYQTQPHEDNASAKLKTEKNSRRTREEIVPVVGETYVLFGRKVKYIGSRISPKGFEQFQIEYLDYPKNEEEMSEGKKGDKRWHRNWKLKRLIKIEE